MAAETRTCQSCKSEFVLGPDDFAFYQRIQSPPPTWCAQCRLRRRLAWRNERTLYKRKCDLCGDSIIAMYSSQSPFTVYCSKCFYSDKRDPMDYGQEYDFSKPFFQQFQELQQRVPQLNLLQANMVDSPWCNYELDDKNCYLNFGGHLNEDSAYNQYALRTKSTFDTFWFMKGDFGYETILCENSHKVFYSRLCYDSIDTYLSFDCRNCSNVFGCTGLRHKKYYIWNQPVSKEEFESFMKENWIGSREKVKELREKAFEVWRAHPQRATFIDHSTDCSGNFIWESKRCHACWLAEKTEDSKDILYTLAVKDSRDTTSVWDGELLYELIAGTEQLSRIKYSIGALKASTDLEYCVFAWNASQDFGCNNIRNKKYCILNKQYSESEYRDLTAKIRVHMNEMPYVGAGGRTYRYGEFFPLETSYFAYNESLAFEYFPVEKSGALQDGLRWNDQEGEKYTISDYVVPDKIGDVKDDVLEKILRCDASGKAFRLIPMELEFYRRFRLPVPTVSPFERHRARLRFIADHLELKPRTCARCSLKVSSVYSEEEFPIVYCETCYQSYIA